MKFLRQSILLFFLLLALKPHTVAQASIFPRDLGQEVYQFSLDAGLAVSSVQDMSGNMTTFTYGDAWTAPTDYRQFFSLAGFNGFYADPTSQTNALGQTKSFTYDPLWRVMKSTVDEAGRVTSNDIDPLGRRTSEIMSDAAGQVLKTTLFAYGNVAFPGVVTQSTVQNLGGPAWAKDTVTQNVLEGNGRLAQQIVDPGGLNLATQSTYDASGSKLSSTDPNGGVTYFGYDARHRLTGVAYPDGTGKGMAYDARGNKTSEIG